MNSYQKFNKEKYEKHQPDMFGWSFERCCGYKCIDCGGEVSPATIKYFDYNIDNLKCYDCQLKKDICKN